MTIDSSPALDSLDRRLLAAAVEREYFETRSPATLSALAAEFDLSEAETKRRLARGMATVVREHRETEESRGRRPGPATPVGPP